MPENLPGPTDRLPHPPEESATEADRHARFSAVTAEVRESTLQEACSNVMQSLGQSEEAPSGSGHPGASNEHPSYDFASATAFEDIAEPVDARDQHVPAPGIAKTIPVLLAAPGYPLEVLWFGLDVPATVGQLCADIKELGSFLFGEIGDCLTPTHPQLEIGVASFVVTPPWFAEANLAAVLVDARAIQGTVFSVVLSYPTRLEEIRRAVGFVSVAEHEVYAAGDNEPLAAGRAIPLQSGVLVKLLPPRRVPLWAAPLAFALWHPYMWPAGPSLPHQGFSLRALILHSSGKYILDNFGDDDWANLNHVARLVRTPLAELSVEPAAQAELAPYVYHGARIRCVLAVTPKPPERDASGRQLSFVLFVDSRPVGYDVNFICLDQGFILREQLMQHLQQPPPPGWQLVVRGGQRRGLGFDFVHGEVLTLAFARQTAVRDGHLEEQPESEHDFSPDEEEPSDDLSEDRRARTRTRSRTPGRGEGPTAGQDASSDHSYQGLDDKVNGTLVSLVKNCASAALYDASPSMSLNVNLHVVPFIRFRGPSFVPSRFPSGNQATAIERANLPALRDIGDRSPERPDAPVFAVEPPFLVPAQPTLVIRGLFVVLAEGYRPEIIPLDLRLPVDIASVREEMQSVRLPICKHRFPYLIPMPYQPSGQFAIFLAAPAWTKDEVEVAFDCRGLGGMVHAKCVPHAHDGSAIA